MIQVMQWVLRANRLECLKAAASISLSVDDRADFRIVRYRCSFASTSDFLKATQQSPALSSKAPPGLEPKSLQAWADMDPLVREGVLAVLKPNAGLENTIAKQDADKSQSMADSVLEAFSKACENVEGKIDEDALANILVKVKHFVADQGTSAQKSGQLLSTRPSLPNLIWVSQDPAHQVRIAAKDPLHANEGFRDQWERLFAAKHALVPDIQNSVLWTSRLKAAQGQVLRGFQTQGGGLTKILGTLSFAKQRFDSTSSPMLRYCCMIRAIAILCAMQAMDDTWPHGVVFNNGKPDQC